MIISAKDLRFKISMLFNVLSRGEKVIVTYKGKPKAKLIPIKEKKENIAFGMWADKDMDVENYVRKLRKGRSFE